MIYPSHGGRWRRPVLEASPWPWLRRHRQTCRMPAQTVPALHTCPLATFYRRWRQRHWRTCLMEGRHRPSFSLAPAQQFAKSRLKCQSCFTVITHVPTQGHNLFMFKCSAFCGHKYLMRAWSCSFVQQPVRTYISREQNSKTFFFPDLPLYVHRRTEEIKP